MHAPSVKSLLGKEERRDGRGKIVELEGGRGEKVRIRGRGFNKKTWQKRGKLILNGNIHKRGKGTVGAREYDEAEINIGAATGATKREYLS